VELLVPEAYSEALHAEFERRCSLGDRMNTENMKSSKFTAMLRDAGVIVGVGKCHQPSTVELAKADSIFAKVLHDCNYGCKTLTYDLFCKALYIVAITATPSIAVEEAFAQMIERVVAAMPPLDTDGHRGDGGDPLLDPHVLLTLDRFKPLLMELFHTFSGRGLDNPVEVTPGVGTVRARERTCWDRSGLRFSTTMEATATLGGAGAAILNSISEAEETISQIGDPYLYASGLPVIADRKNHLPARQLLLMCRELGVTPEYLTGVEVMNIFKSTQVASSKSDHGGSAHDFLSSDKFVDAMALIALKAYSKSPYSEEYPGPHERIYAFLAQFLPKTKMQISERFANDRTVATVDNHGHPTLIDHELTA
jgi:hypothetical protein